MGKRIEIWREYIRYDPATGLFYRRDTGKQTGLSTGHGYIRVYVKEHRIYAHRLAWLLHTGEWLPPKVNIDHKDGDGTNNKFSNLRRCTQSENCANSRPTKGRRFKGISAAKNVTHPWRAQIMVNRKFMHIGFFSSEEDAALAYDAAARKHFGPFSRLNFPKDNTK